MFNRQIARDLQQKAAEALDADLEVVEVDPTLLLNLIEDYEDALGEIKALNEECEHLGKAAQEPVAEA